VVLEGRGARYFRADMAALPALDREALDAAESGLRAVGFQLLGDLVIDQLDRLIVRGYAADAGDAYALHVQTVAGDAATEFITWFADGSILTTTTNGNGQSYPDAKMHVRAYPGLDAGALFRKHQTKVGLFARKKESTPLPFEPSLTNLARRIDEYMVRHSRC
jgi:hypothetical protein